MGIVGVMVIVAIASWFVPYLGYIAAPVALVLAIDAVVSHEPVHDDPYGGLVWMVAGSVIVLGILSAALSYAGDRTRRARRQQELEDALANPDQIQL